jgi:tetratricopeptide (TPR) repeat protein
LVAAYRNLGFAYQKSGQKEKALPALIEVVKLLPESAEAHFDLGLAYLTVGDRNSALTQYATIKGKDPQLAAKLYKAIFRDKLVEARK